MQLAAAGTELPTSATELRFAHSFFSGDHAQGYFLSWVDLGIAAATGVTFDVYLRYGEYGAVAEVPNFREPGAVLAKLKAPSSIDDDTTTLETFTATDVLWEANTRYWIEVVKTAGANAGLKVATTADDSVEPPPADVVPAARFRAAW